MANFVVMSAGSTEVLSLGGKTVVFPSSSRHWPLWCYSLDQEPLGIKVISHPMLV